MCYDDKAQPPLPPGTPGQAHGADIVLTTADGTQFAAFRATPETSHKAQILIYPDVRGLHQFYKELALRFAEVGYPALAIDYFGRTAGLTSRDDSFEFWPHVQQLQLANFTQDVQAALAELRQQNGDLPVFVVGFCMGGSLTVITGTNSDLGFAGLIPFYSGMSRDFGGAGTVLDNAEKVKYPLLGLYGGADQGIPVEQVQEFDRKLTAIGLEHTIKIYEGAPHSFFDRKQAEFAEASADAWEQILSFIAKHSAK